MTVQPETGVPLGRTRLTVTWLGLGTAPLGGLFAPVPALHARRARFTTTTTSSAISCEVQSVGLIV